MTDLEKLDPETRSYVLVGQFLQAWAVMENALHKCIETSFKLTPTITHIICANLQFRAKLHIVLTIIDISAMPLNEDKVKWKKAINLVGEYSSHRNMIAHDLFLADEEGKGVEFLSVKAKGKYELPRIIWSAEKFDEELAVIDDFRSTLNKLNELLKASPIKDELYREAMAKALLNWDSVLGLSPKSLSGGLGLLHSLTQPPVVPSDSESATQEKSSQTPQSPEGKAK